MIGTHAVLQSQCPECIGAFLVDDEITMRVVEIGVNAVTGNPAGVMIEYLHTDCARPREEC